MSCGEPFLMATCRNARCHHSRHFSRSCRRVRDESGLTVATPSLKLIHLKGASCPVVPSLSSTVAGGVRTSVVKGPSSPRARTVGPRPRMPLRALRDASQVAYPKLRAINKGPEIAAKSSLGVLRRLYRNPASALTRCTVGRRSRRGIPARR
jgi:hypothetical protein